MRIIEALDAGDLHAALVAMHEHLSELEARVVAQVRKRAAEEDLGAVFGVQRRAQRRDAAGAVDGAQ
jgi:DNA-binding GntR family transcriptional regulator